MNKYFPILEQVQNVVFEYSPEKRYLDDNSAFDVGFLVTSNNKKGFIGLECKYTDSFSKPKYTNETYKAVYLSSERFTAAYDECIDLKYN